MPVLHENENHEGNLGDRSENNNNDNNESKANDTSNATGEAPESSPTGIVNEEEAEKSIKKKKTVKKRKKKVKIGPNGSVHEGSVIDGSVIDGSVVAGSTHSGSVLAGSRIARMDGAGNDSNVAITNFLADNGKPKKKEKKTATGDDVNANTGKKVLKKKLTAEELRIRESNRIGAVENFNRIRKEKKKKDANNVPDPFTRRAAVRERGEFAFPKGAVIVDMDEDVVVCGGGAPNTIFCGAVPARQQVRSLRKPGDAKANAALRKQQQQVKLEPNPESEGKKGGKCIVM
jgi:hypothetical protein